MGKTIKTQECMYMYVPSLVMARDTKVSVLSSSSKARPCCTVSQVHCELHKHATDGRCIHVVQQTKSRDRHCPECAARLCAVICHSQRPTLRQQVQPTKPKISQPRYLTESTGSMRASGKKLLQNTERASSSGRGLVIQLTTMQTSMIGVLSMVAACSAKESRSRLLTARNKL